MTCDLMTRAPRTGAHRPAQQTALAPEPAGHPHRTPHHQSQVPAQVGPHRIGYHLGIPRSTVGRVLKRCRMPNLACIDQATGLPVRKPTPVRYEHDDPGGRWSTSTSKSSGASPTVAGGGCSAGALTRTGRPAGPVTRPGGKVRNPAGATGICITRSTVIPGWCTRRSSTTSIKTPRRCFWRRASGFFASLGVRVGAVMTDNGACYRSRAFVEALRPGVKHRTRGESATDERE